MVRFWGVRGSIPTPGEATVRYGGNTSCVEVRLGGELIILDAGTGIRLLGDSLVQEFGADGIVSSLLMSHTHWDHIQGLPFFAPAYQNGNALRIYGFEGAKTGLERVLSDQMERPHFPIPMDKMVGDVTVNEFSAREFQIGPVKVEIQRLNHPGGSTGYRLSWGNVVIVYLPDNEPVSYTQAGKGEECFGSGEDPNLDLIEFVRGADIAIMDAQYDAEEYASHAGWGHGCVDEVVKIAGSGQVKRLALFHHDPYHDDAWIDAAVKDASGLAKSLGSDLEVTAACEGEAFVCGGQDVTGVDVQERVL